MAYCDLTCPWCKSTFPSIRNAGKYCSLKCAVDSRIDVRGEDECWPWTGGIFQKDGYGRLSFKNNTFDAHHAAYLVHVGPVPKPLVVRHSCDNPICCNYLKHLLTGTVKQNAEDAVERRRYHFGDANYAAKLTVEQVYIIRSMSFELFSYKAISELLGCGLTTVFKAYRGDSWRHI